MRTKILSILIILTIVFLSCDDSAVNPGNESTYNMILIPAGEFIMGSGNGGSDEAPEHTVYLDAYYIDKYEITNWQYAEFLNSAYIQGLLLVDQYSVSMNGFELLRLDDADCQINFKDNKFEAEAGREDYPVIEVTWYGANAYAEYYNKRLPTEAEWEKAARGTDKRVYPWGNEQPTSLDCNYSQNVGSTVIVGYYSPRGDSPYGCCDMAGNVWEWCADWYDASYYRNSPSDNPQGPSTGKLRVARGGSWFSVPADIRTTARAMGIFESLDGHTGFRCVKTPEEED